MLHDDVISIILDIFTMAIDAIVFVEQLGPIFFFDGLQRYSVRASKNAFFLQIWSQKAQNTVGIYF